MNWSWNLVEAPIGSVAIALVLQRAEPGLLAVHRNTHHREGKRQDHAVVDGVANAAVAFEAEANLAVGQARDRDQWCCRAYVVAKRPGQQSCNQVIAAADMKALVAFGAVEIEVASLVDGQNGDDVEGALLIGSPRRSPPRRRFQ